MTTPRPLSPPLAPKPADAPKKSAEPDVMLLSQALASRRPVEIKLHDGDIVRGHVRSFGQYTISIAMETGPEIVIFKNFVATARSGDPR